MAYFTNSNKTEKLQIAYEDLGTGQSVVFIAGWPLTHQMWEYQMTPLREKGFRCIAYDRRGFGKSDQSLSSYDYDELASDLNDLMNHLDLKNAVLVGFSMGGGEVIRYLSMYGSSRVSKIVLISAVVPHLLQSTDNPNGVPQEQFDEFETAIRTDRPDFINTFGKQFYGVNLISHPVSQGILDWTASLALTSSQKAMINCMEAFAQTDFKNELFAIDVPALIIHGDKDETVPMEATGQIAASLIPGAIFKIYEGAPHGLFITEKEQLNNDLVTFLEH